jgi:hypothetical protein
MRKVRWSTLQFGDHKAINDIKFPNFSILGTEYCELSFADGTLATKASEQVNDATYNSDDPADVADSYRTGASEQHRSSFVPLWKD